jgi:hypothetical protein
MNPEQVVRQPDGEDHLLSDEVSKRLDRFFLFDGPRG